MRRTLHPRAVQAGGGVVQEPWHAGTCLRGAEQRADRAAGGCSLHQQRPAHARTAPAFTLQRLQAKCYRSVIACSKSGAALCVGWEPSARLYLRGPDPLDRRRPPCRISSFLIAGGARAPRDAGARATALRFAASAAWQGNVQLAPSLHAAPGRAASPAGRARACCAVGCKRHVRACRRVCAAQRHGRHLGHCALRVAASSGARSVSGQRVGRGAQAVGRRQHSLRPGVPRGAAARRRSLASSC